jgi:hypothetical protein
MGHGELALFHGGKAVEFEPTNERLVDNLTHYMP